MAVQEGCQNFGKENGCQTVTKRLCRLAQWNDALGGRVCKLTGRRLVEGVNFPSPKPKETIPFSPPFGPTRTGL